MATNQETESLEKTLDATLERTDFGHIINENKRTILIIGAIILFLIIAYSIMDTVQSNKRSERMDAIFKVEQTVFADYLDGKKDDAAFKSAFASLSNELQAEANLIPSMLQALNKLEKNNALDTVTLSTADTWMKKMDKKNNLYLFTAIRMSAIYEDQNQLDKSIALMEELLGNKAAIMQDRIHFDLGRWYLTKGSKAKAKEHFDSVIALETESEFKNIAKIYLSEI